MDRSKESTVGLSRMGALRVRHGDTISGYCASLYRVEPKDTRPHWGEFGRMKGARIVPLEDPSKIVAGELLYHIPTYNAAKATRSKPRLKLPPPRKVVTPLTETLIEYETDVRGGTLGIRGVNDAYDLYLYELSSGDLRLDLGMKLQFFFKDTPGNSWTEAEKGRFVREWRMAVIKNWGGRVIKHLPSGRKVHLGFDLQTQIGGWMLDHWEISVTKIPSGAFRRSSVNSLLGNVTLDSEDLRAIPKGCPGHTQKGAVHEFGHMLGLPDEYPAGGTHAADCASTMHSGSGLRDRFDSTMVQWLNRALLDHGIR